MRMRMRMRMRKFQNKATKQLALGLPCLPLNSVPNQLFQAEVLTETSSLSGPPRPPGPPKLSSLSCLRGQEGIPGGFQEGAREEAIRPFHGKFHSNDEEIRFVPSFRRIGDFRKLALIEKGYKTERFWFWKVVLNTLCPSKSVICLNTSLGMHLCI